MSRNMSRRGSLASGSTRGWGTSSIREVFTTPGTYVFQKSGREDDEDELMWAAIERLPTYDRLRKGLLTNILDDGKVVREEIDVANLGPEERQNLMKNMQKAIDDDNERLLERLRDRDAFVGSRALPTLFNSTINSIENVLGFLRLFPSKKRVVKILHKVSGIVAPSRMTLLLGPPGSGKTTLLQALAGKLEKDLRVTGKVTYCGHEMNEFVPQRTCAYISQHDLYHEMLAELSRREKAEGIKPDAELDAFMKAIAVSGQKSSLVTEYVLRLLGLDICSDTMVGDDMRRGISGGQKKTCDHGRNARGTREGQVVYQGLRTNVLEFFEHVGFKCPERKGVADFLQEVTSRKDQEQYWFNKSIAYRYVSVDDFVHHFQNYHIGLKIAGVLHVPYDKSKAHPVALVTNKYGISNKELFNACLSREWLLMKRNAFVYIFKTTQITIMVLFTFTVFFRTTMKHGDLDDGGGKYYGALFFSLINVMFNGMAELALTIFLLPVFYKQRDSNKAKQGNQIKLN
ncbi:hypothetical protein L1987_23567 [Smallanthus sonchifolius]|uniref:Uncharacterized protein n=1 Tax=Smallanthus sonchifolius TaxID=185202 RepID=A0ACB9IJS7_9ASTR|nr:hypothetical protein L1987_23567 [Smallanthus sonchifolius]